MKYGAHVVLDGPDFTTARALGLPSSKAKVGCVCGAAMLVEDFAGHIRDNGRHPTPSDRPHATVRVPFTLGRRR